MADPASQIVLLMMFLDLVMRNSKKKKSTDLTAKTCKMTQIDIKEELFGYKMCILCLSQALTNGTFLIY